MSTAVDLMSPLDNCAFLDRLHSVYRLLLRLDGEAEESNDGMVGAGAAGQQEAMADIAMKIQCLARDERSE